MSLNVSLNNALSGLQASQQSMQVISQNLANANTDGYSREVVQQSSINIANIGAGVKIDAVVRKVDNYLIRAMQTQNGVVQSNSVVNDYQSRIQTLLGSPGSGSSLDAYLSNFMNAMQQLSDAPDLTSGLSAMVGTATTLSTHISNLAQSLQDLRFQADGDIKTAIDSVNQALTTLTTINKSIAAAAVSGQSTAGLQDERDSALKIITQNMNVTTSYDQYGVVTVSAPNGVGLVDGLNHQLAFTPATSAQAFINNQSLSALQVLTLDSKGNQVSSAQTLVTGGASDQVTSAISTGNIAGLQQMRDDILPGILEEIDSLASNLRDTVNAANNAGTAFPPPNSLTGTRALAPDTALQWSGSVRIAALQADGSPVHSPYADEPNGLAPLTLDLSSLNSGFGDGKPTVQTIVDEINNYFHASSSKVELGNLNNIRLASDTDSLPSGSPSLFNFDFDLQNLSATRSQFFVTGLQVKDDTGTDITNVSQPPKTLALQPDVAYNTNVGSSLVTVTTQTTPQGLNVGDEIYLGPPGSPTVHGIPAANLTGYVKVTGINGKQITFDSGFVATGSGNVIDNSGVTLQPPITVGPGVDMRTRDQSEMQVNLNGNPASTFYDVTATVATVQPDGTISNSQITFRVANSQRNLLNKRYDATSATLDGTRMLASATQDPLKAILVDANGTELPKDTNGKYVQGQAGYLKIVSSNPSYGVAIDSLDSKELGDSTTIPPVPASNRGFSYFFELNNFFDSNQPTPSGDTVANSALHLKVADRIENSPNLIATAQMAKSSQPADPNAPPAYTYQLFAGDNTNAAKLASINNQLVTFQGAGSLPATTVTLGAYTSSFLASVANAAATAKSNFDSSNTLLSGLQAHASAVSGVNIDEELANTVTYQNSYAASARVVTIVNQMYQELFGMIQ